MKFVFQMDNLCAMSYHSYVLDHLNTWPVHKKRWHPFVRYSNGWHLNTRPLGSQPLFQPFKYQTISVFRSPLYLFNLDYCTWADKDSAVENRHWSRRWQLKRCYLGRLGCRGQTSPWGCFFQFWMVTSVKTDLEKILNISLSLTLVIVL